MKRGLRICFRISLIILIISLSILIVFLVKGEHVVSKKCQITYVVVTKKSNPSDSPDNVNITFLKDCNNGKVIHCKLDRVWKTTNVGDKFKMHKTVTVYENGKTKVEYEFLERGGL